MKVLLVTLLLLLTGQASSNEDADHYDRVRLSASAQARVENDTVIATLFAQEEGSDAAQLADIVNRRINEALRAVRQHDTIRYQTSSYSSSPVYNKNKIAGWRVSQTIRLESSDMAVMSELLGQLQRTLAVQSITFGISPDLKNRTDDALIVDALEVFERRAKTITRQLGRKNYRIVAIDVSTSGNAHPLRAYEMAAMSDAVASPSIEGGERTLQVTVTGQIEME